MNYKIQQRKLKLNFTHCETSTTAYRTILTLFLPSEQLNIEWNRRCQGAATAQFPILAKKGLRPDDTASLSYVLSYRAPREKKDTRLFAT